jgi:formylglycine-generating enzyme
MRECYVTVTRSKGPMPHAPAFPNMIWIPGGTFHMGSDQHYPEEAPVHRVTVDGLWIDRTPVTKREFCKFVNATGYVTFAEIPPDPKDYPGALPQMLKAASLVFHVARACGGQDGNWVQTMPGKGWNTLLRLYGPL